MAHNLEARLNSYWPIALTVFRVVFGLLFLCQGLSKLIGWPDVAHIGPGRRMAGLLRRLDRTGHRRADHCRPVHPACRVRGMRRDGVRLLHRAPAARLLPDHQRRRAGGDVLLRLLPADLRRRWRLRPRCPASSLAVGRCASTYRLAKKPPAIAALSFTAPSQRMRGRRRRTTPAARRRRSGRRAASSSSA